MMQSSYAQKIVQVEFVARRSLPQNSLSYVDIVDKLNHNYNEEKSASRTQKYSIHKIGCDQLRDLKATTTH